MRFWDKILEISEEIKITYTDLKAIKIQVCERILKFG